MWSKRWASSSVVSATPPCTTRSAGPRAGDDLGDHRGGRPGASSDGLSHHGVAGGNGGGHGLEGQLDGVVPRRDDADDAERLGHEAGHARFEGQRRADPAGLRPRGQVGDGVVDLADAEADVRGPRLERRLAQVGGRAARPRACVRVRSARRAGHASVPDAHSRVRETPRGVGQRCAVDDAGDRIDGRQGRRWSCHALQSACAAPTMPRGAGAAVPVAPPEPT